MERLTQSHPITRILADSGAVRRVVFSTTEPEFRWIDVIAPDRPTLHSLTQELGLPPSTTEDCLDPRCLPKYERHGAVAFIILRAHVDPVPESAASSSELTQPLRNAQPSVVALDIIALMDALRIEKAILAGYDWGARTANVISALWPERCRATVSVSGYLIGSPAANKAPLPPKGEFAWWYQFYFATERGRAGYEAYRRDFAKLIWQTASPTWRFDDATFDRSAASFDNPDHVAIVIHNYRWRLGLAEGEARYDDIEKRLAVGPAITVPTITMEGDANGAPHADPAAYRGKFSGRYEHRLIPGVGHNLPQEAPRAFAGAVIDVAADR